jgi:chromate reductase, NAD(P)H dehydrogenase (quinone)
MERIDTNLRVVGISGSLRRASYNSGLLRAAARALPPGMTLEVLDIASLPLYNADVDAAGAPPSVLELRARIAAADALLIATPEYNYSVSGVLKNAIDWASRPPRRSPLVDKPLAIMGAGGRFGTVRAQLHLRQIAQETGMLALNKPEVLVARPWEKFSTDGELQDEATGEHVRALLEALARWTRRLRGELAVEAVV